MFRKFLALEWKSFFRASSFTGNMVMKIIMIVAAIYFAAIFFLAGFGTYYLIEESLNQDPLVIVSKFALYYLVVDIVIRLFLQKIPVINIRPLLTLPIKRSTIVNFALGKTAVSFFNLLHAFFFVPFSLVLIKEGYDVVNVVFWHLGMMALLYCNNFLNILLNDKDNLFIIFIVMLAVFGGLQYYEVFDITKYTSTFFHGMYATEYLFIIPLILLAILYAVCFKYLKNHLYLDTGLKGKQEEAKTEDYTWLNQFGALGTFLKNDIKLIRRNKRSKTTMFMSFMFLFYGLLFFTGSLEVYDNPMWKMFAAIFVTGGFLFTFGQFVPSWDSAYYPLMMSQNIQYREYISAKWWLVVIGTALSTLLASFYLYFGLDIYLLVIVGGIYNIGVNSHLVLLGGAFIKTPIDLASSKQAFGDKKAFNTQTFLLSLPKLLLPILFYALGYYFVNEIMGYALVAAAGILGLAFRNKVFTRIEKVYKAEKYKTLAAYKQKN
ncbi:DUF5687 family protein [Flavobacterium sp. MK4S-17]|uniref:DUF5687 family protein n=1 Tax=Flavobacterium sp. MK4S-17 TaxID=2543737 RepID=UPI001357B123|nr:DUF5687 family protein [Flavobacterium sp. MK4S-17]